MKPQQSTQFKSRRIIASLRKIARTKLFVYFLCVIVSFGIWTTFSLSEKNIKSLELNIRFINHPKNLTLVNQPEKKIYINITSTSNNVNFLNQNKKKFIDLDVSKIELTKAKNQYIGNIKPREYLNSIASQLMVYGDIEYISPDSISLVYEKNISKKIPVDLNVNYQFPAQHWISSEISIKPDSVTITGLSSDIDTISRIKTVYKDFKTLYDSVKIILPLEIPKTNYPLLVSEDSIKIIIPIEQFTEKSFTIPINVNDKTNEFKIKTFPDIVTVSCLVSIKKFNQLADSMFEAAVFYNEQIDKNSSMLPVQIIHSLDYVKISKITPQKVEYIIIK